MNKQFGSDFLEGDDTGLPDREKVLSHYQSKWNISAEEYSRRVDEQIEREKRVPPLGEITPDFELEKLTAEGGRTGEMYRLSEHRGAPLALAFGSYT
jgi:hypothetical protein